jgi:TRAP-type C4-dicarboxylate transport system permease small subunit
LKKLSEIVDLVIKIFAVISLIVMVALIFYNAILRYFFHAAIPASEEFSRFAFIWVCFMGVIIAHRAGEHVSVTLIVERLKGVPYYVVRVLKEMVVFGTMGLICYGSVRYVMVSTWLTPATEIPFWIVSISIAIMAFCFLIMSFANLVKDIGIVRAGGKLYVTSEKEVS